MNAKKSHVDIGKMPDDENTVFQPLFEITRNLSNHNNIPLNNRISLSRGKKYGSNQQHYLWISHSLLKKKYSVSIKILYRKKKPENKRETFP